jgi:hypothetical protein
VNPIFTREGMKRLRTAWILLGACVAAAVVLIGGTHVYLQKEERDAQGGSRRLLEARARVDNIRRERDNLEESATIYRSLIARGLMQPERRLDLVELVNRLRAEYRIFSVDYEMAPQRALPLAGNASYASVDILASRVSLRVRALHEGDVLGFIRAIGETRQGFHPVDRCLFKRIDGAASGILQPRVEAECSLEWITLKEKRSA